jgi:hypothetical protein
MAEKTRVKAEAVVCFGDQGGAELFFKDIDGDGRPEILAYQGSGVFGAKNIYETRPYVTENFPKLCVSAFKPEGTCVWTWGEPNIGPYISHAHESCVAAGDIDGDGRTEVAVADGARVILLDGATGEVRAEKKLPDDNFYVIQVLGQPAQKGEAAILVQNEEDGYHGWGYGQPTIGLTASLDIAWGPREVTGSGHAIWPADINGDGRNEYLSGYTLLDASGNVLWVLDSVDPKQYDPLHDHVDYTDLRFYRDKKVIAVAGSSKVYLSTLEGRTIFSHPGPHVQGCALGRFRKDSDFQLAVYNAPDGPIQLYDPLGKLIWERESPRRWPFPLSAAVTRNPFHRNRPIIAAGGTREWIIYSDGGWPWGMDGTGEISLEFVFPPQAAQPEFPLPKGARSDDMGFGFAVQAVDIDGDGRQEILIYDRRTLWVYRTENL